MRHFHIGIRACASALALAGLLAGGGAFAADDKVAVSISAGKQIFENGKEGISPCQSCHGPAGLGIDAMQTPRLANIGYAYIVKQLTNFADDARTDTTLGVMNMFAKQLTPEERRNVAAYLNTLEMKSEPSDLAALKAEGKDVGEPYKGEILVRYGVIGKAPACQSCHGYNGRGADPIYPMIGQQKYNYLVNQLKHWRAQERTNDPVGQMRAVAKGLTDEDIYNAAAYLSRAPKTVIGNNFVPDNQSVLANVKVDK